MERKLDYEEIFKILNKDKVKYLVVGAYAVIYYTEPRYTKDIDIWVKPEITNAKKTYNSLRKFGAPLNGVKASDFTKRDMVYQIGVAPIRIDVLMNIKGIHFDLAWKHRKKVKYGKEVIGILNLNDVVKSKMKAGRKQDILDLEKLEKVKNRNKIKQARKLGN